MRSRVCGERAGCGAVLYVPGLPGAVCLRRLVSLILLRAALLSAAENRVTDREKEESCGL